MSEQTMVDRVARALCAEQSAAGLRADWTASLDSRPFEDRVKHSVELHWKQYVPAARAAITAMREPTEAMIEARWRANGDDVNGRPLWKCANDIAAKYRYQAMIDAALSEEIEA